MAYDTKTMTTEKIKIAVICHDGQPYGAQQSLLVMLKHTPTNDVDWLVSLAKDGPFREALEALPNVKVFTHQRLAWIKHRPSKGIKRLIDISVLGLNCLLRVPKLAQWIKQQQIQIVQVNSSVSLEGPLAAKLAGIPCVWHLRELFMNNNPRFVPILGQPLTQKIIATLPTKTIAISNAVVSNNPYLKNNPSAHVIYNSVEVEAHTAKSKPQNPLKIGYVGRISNTKRFDEILEVSKGLKQKQINFELHVAGHFVDAKYEKAVFEFIRNHQLEKHILFKGFLTNITDFYNTLDCLIFTSTHDSFGRSVIEAMACGVVVLATNTNALPEIIDHKINSFLYTPNHIDEIIAILETLIDQPEKFKALSEKAIEKVQTHFSPQVQVEKIKAVYQSLLQ